jgi:dTDP-4-dehydrorhamnose reductase
LPFAQEKSLLTSSHLPRYLIIGSDGTIGNALLKHFNQHEVQAIGTTRRLLVSQSADQIFLDLNDGLANWHIPAGIEVVINCAAVARLEACKRDPVGSRRINVESVIAIAEKCRERGIFFVHLSTDKVFSGQSPHMPADAPFSPITEYGRQKAEAETYLLKLLEVSSSLTIVRLTKVLTQGMSLFHNWLEALLKGEVIHPFRDMTMAPVAWPFVLKVLEYVVAKQRTGIFQLSADQDISYAEAAIYLAYRLDVPMNMVKPINVIDAHLFQESIPCYTSLNIGRIQLELGIRPEIVYTVLEWSAGLIETL